MLRQGTNTTGKLTIAKQVADMKEQTEYMRSYRQALGSALNEVQALKSELGRQKSVSKKSLVSDVSKTTIGEKNSHVVAEMTQVTVSASSTLDRIKAKVEYKSKMYSSLTGQLRAFAKALTRRDKKLAEKIELNKELNARVRELESARMTTDNELAICRNRLMQSEKLLITREREIFYQGKEISRLDRYVWELSGRLGQLESHIDQYKHFDRNWNVSAQGSYARPAVASTETAEQYSMHRSMPAAASPRSNTHRPHSYTRNNRYHANTKSSRKPCQVLYPICEEENTNCEARENDYDETTHEKSDSRSFTHGTGNGASDYRITKEPDKGISTGKNIYSKTTEKEEVVDTPTTNVVNSSFQYMVVDVNKTQLSNPTSKTERIQPYLNVSTNQNFINETPSGQTFATDNSIIATKNKTSTVIVSDAIANCTVPSPVPLSSTALNPIINVISPRSLSPTSSSVTTEENNSDAGTPGCSSDSSAAPAPTTKDRRQRNKRSTKRSRKHIQFRGNQINVTSFSMQEFREIMWSTCADDSSTDEFLNFLAAEAQRLNQDPILCSKHTLGQPADWLSLKGCY